MPGSLDVTWLGGPPVRDLTVVNDADGRLVLFARSVGDEIVSLHQLAPGGAFADHWVPLGIAAPGPVSATLAADGRLQMVVRGGDGAIWHAGRTVPNHVSFSPWTTLGGWKSPSRHFADPVAALHDGRVLVFASGSDGAVWYTGQINADQGSWSPWRRIAAHPVASRPATVHDAAGRLNLLVRGENAAIWQYTLQRDGEWTWASLGGVVVGAPVAVLRGPAAAGAPARLEVFARGANGALWHCHETRPDVFAPWQQLSYHAPLAYGARGEPVFAARPQLVENRDGRLELVVAGDALPYLWHAAEVAPASGWTAWRPLILGEVGDSCALARHRDGRIALFFVDRAGRAGHVDQLAPGAWQARRRLAARAGSR
jgi:hypothetical protein